MKTSERPTVRRLAPCPPYDVEACESWLQDMAEQGLMLERWTVIFEARFRRETPRPVRYRLTAARLKGNVLFIPPGRPDAGEEALYEEAGWHFVCRQNEFYIYACDDPAAPEPHTDPAVQALSLKMACRSAVFSFVCWAIVIALRSSELFSGDGFLNLVEYPLTALVFAFCYLSLMLTSLQNLYCIFSLRRKLKRGLPPDHHKNWRWSAPLHRCANGLWRLALPFLIVLLFCVIFHPDRSAYLRNTEEEKAAMPFATMEDLADGAFVPYAEEGDAFYNSVETRRTLLAPRIIEFRERGRIVQGDDVLLDAYMTVNYYDTLLPLLARLLAPALHGQEELLADVPLTAPELPGMDAVYFYGSESGAFWQLILVQDDRVMSVLMTAMHGEKTFSELIPRIAAGFDQS